jgi:hypothetical protein
MILNITKVNWYLVRQRKLKEFSGHADINITSLRSAKPETKKILPRERSNSDCLEDSKANAFRSSYIQSTLNQSIIESINRSSACHPILLVQYPVVGRSITQQTTTKPVCFFVPAKATNNTQRRIRPKTTHIRHNNGGSGNRNRARHSCCCCFVRSCHCRHNNGGRRQLRRIRKKRQYRYQCQCQ